MFRTIVVGCDGTESADQAVALAQQLRDPAGGRIVLVSAFSVYQAFGSPVTPFVYADWLKRAADEQLARAAARLGPDVPSERQTIAAASAAEGLDDIATTVGADLIVVGPTHRSKLGTFTGRSTVQRMLHGAPCAVAVAAPGQDRRFAGAPRIAVAYDGSPEAGLALDAAWGIARSTGAAVRLCHALHRIVYPTGYTAPLPDAEDDAEREAEAVAHLERAAAGAPSGVAVETAVGWGASAPTILGLAGDGVDLVVAGSRGYGPLHRVFAGSTSTGLLTGGAVPVLVTPRIGVTR